MQKKFWVIGGTIAIMLVVGFFYSTGKKEVESAVQLSGTNNVIGTRVGTTTTGVTFAAVSGYSATSTYYATTTGVADIATFRLMATDASTTPSGGVHLSFYGSSDYNCMTATTSTILWNTVLVSDINWYDIGSHQLNLAGNQTLPAGTSTFTWLPMKGSTKDIVLTNLNYECIKVEAAGSSTVLFMSISTKGNY